MGAWYLPGVANQQAPSALLARKTTLIACRRVARLTFCLSPASPLAMLSPLSKPLFWRVAVLVWGGVLYWLSAQPSTALPGGFPGIDKVEHATYFTLGGMCFLLGLRLAGLAQGKAAAIVLTVLFCSFVGVLDEWHQLHVPGRSGGDVWDWLADTLGGFLGAHAAFWMQRRLTSASTTTAPR
jgi:VanZ family protein